GYRLLFTRIQVLNSAARISLAESLGVVSGECNHVEATVGTQRRVGEDAWERLLRAVRRWGRKGTAQPGVGLVTAGKNPDVSVRPDRERSRKGSYGSEARSIVEPQ